MCGYDCETKVCTKCNKTLPKSPMFFYREGKGLRSECKKCNNKKRDKHIKSLDKEKYRQRNRRAYLRSKKRKNGKLPEEQEKELENLILLVKK